MKKISIVLIIVLSCFMLKLGAQCDPVGGDNIYNIRAQFTEIQPFIPLELPNSATPPEVKENRKNDRYVFWLHGFGGKAGAWEKPAAASEGLGPNNDVDALPDFPARKLKSIRLDYNTNDHNNSLEDAASYLQDYQILAANLQAQFEGIEIINNFMIAHSEGGIVSRMYEKLFQNNTQESKFGGLVTFGSSHGGATIINNKESINTLAVDACNALLEPVADIMVSNIILGSKPFDEFILETFRPGIIDPKTNTTFGEIKEKFCEHLLPTALQTLFAGQLKPIGDDYAVGAQKITDLAQFSTDIPKISVYGVEVDNHLWRALHNMVISPSADQPLFEAEDNGTVVFINDLSNSLLNERNNRLNSVVYRRAQNLIKTRFRHINPIAMWQAEVHIGEINRKVDKINTALHFLGTMNDKWLNIIGAVYYDISQTDTWECICDGYLGGTDEIRITIEPGEECSIPGWGCYTVMTTSYSATGAYKPNDAIVTNESSLSMPGMNTSREMRFSNHMQMRNDERLKEVLKRLFNGDILSYFNTKER